MPSPTRHASTGGVGATGKERYETGRQGTETMTEGEVDIQALAERIYRLLQEEARLESQRLGIRRGR